jgi:hypothetical protein
VRENYGSFGKEDAATSVPPIVVAVPGVDVPLDVVGVPVDVHDAGPLSYPVSSVPLLIEYSPSCI